MAASTILNGNEKVPCKEWAVSFNLENGKKSKIFSSQKKKYFENEKKKSFFEKCFLGSKASFPGANSNFSNPK